TNKKEQKPEYIIMSALFSSFLIFTKNEGSAFVLINLLILGILTAFNFDKTKFKQIILYLSIVCVLSSPWLVFRWNLSMDIDYPHLLNISNVLNNINILKYIFAAFVKEFLTFSKWNLLWVFLGLSTLLNFRYTLKLPVLYLTLLPFFSFLMYMVICIVEPSDINEKMYTLLFRLVIHFLPLAVFLMAEQLNPLFRREQK
ncbi:MAG: hypothetical protein M1155_00395, partial [Patescibacteria group bacterium]|nr:hypothetical protein [Patescibacteria group bacterium]